MAQQGEKESVRAAVKEILAEADMEVTTAVMVRKMAAERTGIDESAAPWLKKLVKELIEEFVKSREEKQQDEGDGNEEEEEEAAKPAKKKKPNKSLADGEDDIICQLSAKRNVSVQNFRGKPLVSIREYYEKDGKTLPTSKGISLTVEQWEAFKKGMPAIKEAIQTLESR